MQSPPSITARNTPLPALDEQAILDRIAKLETFFDRILYCRVVVEGPGPTPRGKRHRVRITIGVPGNDIVISRAGAASLEIAIRDAFNAADRRLEDYARGLRGDVKSHPSPRPVGTVSRLLPDRDCGFIDAGGREIYFHRNAVRHPGFDRLAPGTRVRFAEEPGENGPQATVVELVGKGGH